MSRSRLASVLVYTSFLLLIAMSAHSIYVELHGDRDATETTPTTGADESVIVDSLSPAPSRSHAAHEEILSSEMESLDAGHDEAFIRALRECIRINCWPPPRDSPDAGTHP